MLMAVTGYLSCKSNNSSRHKRHSLSHIKKKNNDDNRKNKNRHTNLKKHSVVALKSKLFYAELNKLDIVEENFKYKRYFENTY